MSELLKPDAYKITNQLLFLEGNGAVARVSRDVVDMAGVPVMSLGNTDIFSVRGSADVAVI